MNGTPITFDTARELLNAPSGQRPRIYGRIFGTEQIVAIRSRQNMDTHEDMLAEVWVSDTTIADIITRKGD